jgi:hypothetical protein
MVKTEILSMDVYKYFILLLLVTFILPIVKSKEQLSSGECEDLGFSGLALCSDCHTFSEYVKNQGEF